MLFAVWCWFDYVCDFWYLWCGDLILFVFGPWGWCQIVNGLVDDFVVWCLCSGACVCIMMRECVCAGLWVMRICVNETAECWIREWWVVLYVCKNWCIAGCEKIVWCLFCNWKLAGYVEFLQVKNSVLFTVIPASFYSEVIWVYGNRQCLNLLDSWKMFVRQCLLGSADRKCLLGRRGFLWKRVWT